MDYLSVAMAAEVSKVARFDQSAVLNIPPGAAYKWYQTDGLLDVTSHGTLLLVLISPPVGLSGSITVPFVLEWDIEWSGRKLNPLPYRGGKIMPDPGYENIFTTSDSDYDSNILTFKMHPGGSMVPFSGSTIGAVYKIADGSTAYYNDSDGRPTKAIYFSRVIGFHIPGFVLHPDEQSAVKYQQTGDKAYCLHYHSASDYAKPARPVFQQLVVRDALPQPTSELESLRQQIDALRIQVSQLRTNSASVEEPEEGFQLLG